MNFKKKRIVFTNTPTKLPLHPTVLYGFILYHTKDDFNSIWLGVFISVIVLYWIGCILSIMEEKWFDPNKEPDSTTEKDKEILSEFSKRLQKHIQK